MRHLLFGFVAVMFLGSCNTFIGMGRDFRQLGEGLEHKANGRNFDGSEPGTAQDENLPVY